MTSPGERQLPVLLAAAAFFACDPRGSTSALPDAAVPLVPSERPVDASAEGTSSDAALRHAPVDASPPYSLTADLAARATLARSLFPAAKYPAYSTRLEASVFLLVSPQGPAMLSAGADTLRSALRFFYSGHSTPGDPASPPPFAHHADHAVTVYVFATRAEFLRFARDHEDRDARDLFGFYVPDTGELLVSGQDGLGTEVHELVHILSLADAEAATPRFDLPVWMGEGLASLFEQAITAPDGTMHGQSNGRTRLLQDALRSDAGPEPSLAALFALSNHEFHGGSPLTPEGKLDRAAKQAAEARHYAEARSFCQWMDARDRHKLWDFYRAWRDSPPDEQGKRSAEKAFTAVMGASPASLDADWRKWVLAQPR